MRTKYLIIGNSAGGIGATEIIRQLDEAGTVTIISDEPYPAYSRPLIAEYLAEGRPLEKMLFRPADFYEKNNICTFLGRRVDQLHPDEHAVELENGERITWEKLLLATSGVPIVPPIEGIERKGVFTFTTLDDAKAVDQFLNGVARAVVIGGGLIGVSVTEALVKRGIRVTVVEMKERILNTILDDEASAMVEETLMQAGVSIATGHTVAEVSNDPFVGEAINSVTLDDGRRIQCNLVIIAIGVLPRTELISDTGISVNRGIVVDRHMATSSPDVYACGDVAEAYDFVYDENRLSPIWPNAYIGGRIAGFNMAGIPAEYAGGTAMNSMKYFGQDVVSAGIVNPTDENYEVVSQRYDTTYRKVVLKDGLVVGMVFVYDIEKSGIVFGLMRDKVNVDGFKQELLAYDFSLASLPEEIWRPKLEIPPSGVVYQVPVEQPEEMVMGE
jgi:NAD(P)H-nitrite reductase large subunit